MVSTSAIDVENRVGQGPTVTADSDADPREFLLDLCSDRLPLPNRQQQELLVEVRYFACDDSETFCRPVTQQYRVILDRDRDGGSRRQTGSRNRGRGRRPAGSAVDRQQPSSPMTEAERRILRQRMQRQRDPAR